MFTFMPHMNLRFSTGFSVLVTGLLPFGLSGFVNLKRKSRKRGAVRVGFHSRFQLSVMQRRLCVTVTCVSDRKSLISNFDCPRITFQLGVNRLLPTDLIKSCPPLILCFKTL